MSDCIIGGYDMKDSGSRAGRAGTGINLNGITVRYSLNNNPEVCRKIYNGEIPSYFGEGPTVLDSGTFIHNKDTGELIQIREGDDDVNPAQLASQQAGVQMPTYQFSGALAPQYHDNAQPTTPFMFKASNMVSGGGAPMMIPPQPLSPYNSGFNFNIQNNSQNENLAKQEWDEYQRKYGFKAPPPTDTDFPDAGLLSGFGRGFDPHQALIPKDDEFYDATVNGRIGMSEAIHQNLLAQNALMWGYVPGMIVDRRENMMFPGINENHHMPFPSSNPVYNHMGVQQIRYIPHQPNNTYIPANQLPVQNMVATNPYMAGVNMVGGQTMNYGGQFANVPTPYMQARYNYAIANGFQSVQEMDKNDFLAIKRVSRSVHGDMTDEEFNEFFENNWCKRFTDIYDAKKEMMESYNRDKANSKDREIPRIRVKLVKGDKVLASCDTISDNQQYSEHVRNVSMCNKKTAEDSKAEMMNKIILEAKRAAIFALLYNNAPERKYDDKGWYDFIRHGFAETTIYDLDFKDWKWWNSPERYQAQLRINQTEFMRNCMERGMGFGIPAAHSRLATENKMFYIGEQLPDNEYAGYIRGGYGRYPNGEPLPDMVMPLYGYITIADPEHPDRSIPFPRRHIKDIFEGYQRFASASLSKSKEPFHIMNYDEFSDALGVRIMEDRDFIEKYKDFEPAQKYVDIAKRGMSEEEILNRPPHCDDPNEDILDFMGPTDDIPMDELRRQIEDEDDP